MTAIPSPTRLLPRLLICALLLLAAGLLSACATAPLTTPPQARIEELAFAIRGLGPDVDPAEAERAAQIAYLYPLDLAKSYEITDPPIIHNMKVNNGTRPRGLCYQWADDLEARLAREHFSTLTLHRAIANADNPLRIEHSTVIVSRLGGDMEDGLVLDPWRHGGALFWAPVPEDPSYRWQERAQVFAMKRARLSTQQGTTAR